MNVLIIGGSTDIGISLAKKLVDTSNEVILLIINIKWIFLI